MPARARYISARAVPGLHTASLSAESSKKAARLKAHSPEPSIFTTSQELISALPSRMPHISPLCSPETTGNLFHLNPKSSQSYGGNVCLPCSQLYAGPRAQRSWPYLVLSLFLSALSQPCHDPPVPRGLCTSPFDTWSFLLLTQPRVAFSPDSPSSSKFTFTEDRHISPVLSSPMPRKPPPHLYTGHRS